MEWAEEGWEPRLRMPTEMPREAAPLVQASLVEGGGAEESKWSKSLQKPKVLTRTAVKPQWLAADTSEQQCAGLLWIQS